MSAYFEECDDFSDCNEECGGGVQWCQRKCYNGVVGDDGCPANEEWREQECNTHNCVYYEDCDDYSECSADCGGGIESCERECKNGNVGDDGCPAEDQYKERECNSHDCVEAYFEDCDDFSVCSASCDGGLESCERKCINGNVGDEGCPAVYQYAERECNTHNCVDAYYEDCDDYSDCDADCDGGMQWCERECINGNWGDDGCYETDHYQERECNTHKCAYYEDCDDFSVCSASCDGGIESCERECKNGNVGDEGCPAVYQYAERECNSHQCSDPESYILSNAIVCEDEWYADTELEAGEFECPDDYEVVIVEALYGRIDPDNTQCSNDPKPCGGIIDLTAHFKVEFKIFHLCPFVDS